MRAAKEAKERAAAEEVLRIFDVIDLNGDGELTRDEVVASADKLNMTAAQA